MKKTFTADPVESFIGGLAVHSFSFDNGLKLTVLPDRSAPVVAFQTWVGVGSGDESANKTGLAHLLEHLMFKGTEFYADREFDRRMDLLGAEGVNAWTWLDQTVYVESVPVASFPQLVELEAQRFSGLKLDEESFRSELEVVMNERLLRVDDDPDGQLDERLSSLAFGEGAYGWPTLGWRRDLDAFTLDDVVAFYRRWYAPDHTRLIVVGDVDPESVAALIQGHYGHLQASQRARPQRSHPTVPPSSATLRLPIVADRLLLSFPVPAYDHADIPALLLLDAALTGGRSGRLIRTLQDGGCVAEVDGALLPLIGPSAYQLSATARVGVSALEVKERLFSVIQRVIDEGITEGERAMARAQWTVSTLSSLDDAAGKADFLGWAFTHTGRLSDALSRLERIDAVSRVDVQRVAERYLRQELASVVVGLQETPSPAIALSPLPVSFAQLSPCEVRETQGARPSAESVERVICGATVLLQPNKTLPLVDFRFRFPCGTASSPLAFLAGKMLLRGNSRRPRATFQDALEQLGASVAVSVDADRLLLYGRTLAQSWPATLELLSDALCAPTFSNTELDLLKIEVSSSVDAELDDDQALVEIAWSRALYGDDHPYGRSVMGTPAFIESVQAEQLRDFHARFIHSEGALIGLSGDFDAETEAELSALLKRLSGGVSAQRSARRPPSLRGQRVVLVDKPERSQAQVLIGRGGLEPLSDDFPAFLLYNDAFGVGFGGRLLKEVRVARGWSYFASARPDMGALDTDWSMNLAPANEYAVEAITLVLNLLDQARGGPLEPEEYERVQTTRRNTRPFLLDTAAKRLGLAMAKHSSGYDRLAVLDAIERVSRVEAEAGFSRTLAGDAMVIAVVGTATELEAPLRAAFGALTVVPYREVHGFPLSNEGSPTERV